MEATARISETADTVTSSNTKVGWIGAGVMGRAMCEHILRAGYLVTIFNRTVAKADPLVSLGGRLAPSPRAVSSESDIVFSIVGFPSDVREVLLDPDSGALVGLKPGGVLVDMTTSEPSLAVEIATASSVKGCKSIDAPVSGGDRGARNGQLSIFAGGDQDSIRKLNPLFSLLGQVSYMGGPGSGQFAKLGNQITIATSMVGLVEGLLYAFKSGLNLEAYLKAISKGAAGSKSLELYGSRILTRDLNAGFYVNHFVKDLSICLKECEKMGLKLPGLALAHQLYMSLKADGDGNLGIQSLILALERMNNCSIGP